MDPKYEALSAMDLLSMYRQYAHDAPNIWTYRDLATKSLNQILGPHGKAIILFLNAANHGHWCALYRNRHGLCFFDSYGNKPDDQYHFVPNNVAKSLNGYLKKLTQMLYDEAEAGVPINYNEHSLQKGGSIATCGRWCVVRLLYPEISVDNFYRIFKDAASAAGVTPDDIVVALTPKN